MERSKPSRRFEPIHYQTREERNYWREVKGQFWNVTYAIKFIREKGDGRIPMDLRKTQVRLDHQLKQGLPFWNSICGFEKGDPLQSHPLFKPPEPEPITVFTSTPLEEG